MLKKFVILVCLVALTSACATPYTGPQPDFNAKGKDAQIEVDKFTLGESWWNQHRYGFFMGPKQELYTQSTIEPIISQVSPTGKEYIDESKRLHILSALTFVAGIASLLIAGANTNNGNYTSFLIGGIVGLGLGIGFGVASDIVRVDGIKKYNEDLRQKLGTPTVGWNFKF